MVVLERVYIDGRTNERTKEKRCRSEDREETAQLMYLRKELDARAWYRTKAVLP
jgi:hypothetical protein